MLILQTPPLPSPPRQESAAARTYFAMTPLCSSQQRSDMFTFCRYVVFTQSRRTCSSGTVSSWVSCHFKVELAYHLTTSPALQRQQGQGDHAGVCGFVCNHTNATVRCGGPERGLQHDLRAMLIVFLVK